MRFSFIIEGVKDAQKLATQVFITASILFGINGVIMILSIPHNGNPAEWLLKIQFSLGMIVLSSFGVSVGLKYLKGR